MFNTRLLEAHLNAAIDEALSRKVGTVVKLHHNWIRIYHRAAGYSDRETKKYMESDAIFRLALIAKPIVAIATMHMVKKEMIDLYQPLSDLLPDLHFKLLDGSIGDIRLHHLLSHTSGISYGFLEQKGSIYQQLNISDGLD